jgi:hypothetical protein
MLCRDGLRVCAVALCAEGLDFYWSSMHWAVKEGYTPPRQGRRVMKESRGM